MCRGTHVRVCAGERPPPPLPHTLCPWGKADGRQGGVCDMVALSALTPNFFRLILT